MSKLLEPTGPHPVGYTDWEWQPSPQFKHPIMMRIFYPAETDGGDYGSWIPQPSYYPSYGYYLGWPGWLSGLFWRCVNTKLWAKPNLEPIAKERGLIIFSHGLAGIRTTYSSICTELASQGWLVASLEHRDGSSSLTILRGGEQQITYERPTGQNNWEYRHGQLEYRVQEVEAAIEALRGNGSSETCWIHKAGQQPRSIKWQSGPLVLAGHSFGAATAIQASSKIPNVDRVIALDPWMFPICQSMNDIAKVKVPSLSINSHAFHATASWEAVKRVLDPQHLYKVANSDHMDQSDLPSVLPRWITGRTRPWGAPDPHLVIRLNNQTIGAWLENCPIPTHELLHPEPS